MALPADLPVVDHHCHLHPGGEGLEAARRFAAAGGTHLFLATQNYGDSVPTGLEDYREQFETTVRLAQRIESELRLRVYAVVAPYPVDLVAQTDRLGLPAAEELQLSALGLAARLVEEQRVVARGEVGRPHFPVPAALAESADRILRRALELARDAGCPAVLHTEDLDAEGFEGIARLAAQAMCPVQKVVKHYHRSVLPPERYLGVVPSYLARRELVAEVLDTPAPWFLETDFLDDPRRPGAVLDIATVPRRARAIAAGGPERIERLRRPFQESVKAVYGFTPELSDGRPG